MQNNKKTNNNDVYYIYSQLNELKKIYNKQYKKSIDIKNNDRNIDFSELKVINTHSNENNINDNNINSEKKAESVEKPILHNNEEKIKAPNKDHEHLDKKNISPLPIARIEQILINLEKQINNLVLENDRLYADKLKALADLENNKRMINNELSDVKKYGILNFVKNLLPALDNFERALLVNNVTPEVTNFLLGFNMIMKSIKNVFNAAGVEEIATKIGDPFNSNIHVGIEVLETKQQKSGTIIKILQKGYKIHDRIIRPVSVNVEK